MDELRGGCGAGGRGSGAIGRRCRTGVVALADGRGAHLRHFLGCRGLGCDRARDHRPQGPRRPRSRSPGGSTQTRPQTQPALPSGKPCSRSAQVEGRRGPRPLPPVLLAAWPQLRGSGVWHRWLLGKEGREAPSCVTIGHRLTEAVDVTVQVESRLDFSPHPAQRAGGASFQHSGAMLSVGFGNLDRPRRAYDTIEDAEVR